MHGRSLRGSSGTCSGTYHTLLAHHNCVEVFRDPLCTTSIIGRGHVQATAPVLCWKPERVAADLELSGRLMLQLDQEKGVEGNPLATPPADPAGSLAVLTARAVCIYVQVPQSAGLRYGARANTVMSMLSVDECMS